eukprot:gnl/MRDRNA2_/MRDRNA2_90477_c0_seq1.p1 gnl/MRDRNA2_/MRDRNA2_90477_c0~~gnl/MRDRNA2_/MRDRNA2_90477_c0_seq1.p1  ORF type:complete len:188 (+),score=26.01 gnl/MRDRNA2_/MRDRNA2_90477_c0_seq1:98-661(+)
MSEDLVTQTLESNLAPVSCTAATSATARSGIGNPNTQHQWHETFRDTVKNMYRSSYADMVHGREVSVGSDLPSGYGGHCPSLRHDILFRNTGFDRRKEEMKMNFSRDAFPAFEGQIQGVPTYCTNPRGAKKVPTAGTIPASRCKPPWAVTLPLQEPPTIRTSVPILKSRSGAMTARTADSAFKGLDL